VPSVPPLLDAPPVLEPPVFVAPPLLAPPEPLAPPVLCTPPTLDEPPVPGAPPVDGTEPSCVVVPVSTLDEQAIPKIPNKTIRKALMPIDPCCGTVWHTKSRNEANFVKEQGERFLRNSLVREASASRVV
jgi:hypothetical protein